jgi:hypothetical protein
MYANSFNGIVYLQLYVTAVVSSVVDGRCEDKFLEALAVVLDNHLLCYMDQRLLGVDANLFNEFRYLRDM